MKGAGLARRCLAGLRRISRVERSASAWMWQRPTVEQHYQSFAVIPAPRPPDRIVLIDDVITKGRTLLAAALRLHRPSQRLTFERLLLCGQWGWS